MSANYANQGYTDSPKRSGQVSQALSQLEKTQHETEALLAELESGLSPVLRGVNAEPSGDKDSPEVRQVLVPVADDANRATERAQRINRQIRSIIERLEL